MKKKNFFEPKNSSKLTESPEDTSEKVFPDYQDYPEGEDIYSRDKETQIDPEKLAERPLKAESGADDEILKKNPHLVTDPIDTPEVNWMTLWKQLVMKMRKTTTTALAEIIMKL